MAHPLQEASRSLAEATMLLLLLALQDVDAPPAAPEPPRPVVSVAPRLSWWKPVLDGRVIVDLDNPENDRNEDQGPSLGLSDDLALGEREGLPWLELEVSAWNPHRGARGSVRAVLFRHAWSASSTLAGDHGAPAGGLADGASLDSRFFVGYYGADLLVGAERPDAAWSGGGLVGLRYFHTDLDLDTPDGRLDDQAGGCGLGLGAWGAWRPVDGLVLAGECAGYGTFGVPVAHASIALGVESERLRVDLGWRSIWMDGDLYDDLRVTLRGPSLSLSIRF
jgi:hypothetical protein